MKITFFGATQKVTGSRYLLEAPDMRVLVECGLYQGVREIRKHNLDPFPVDPSGIDAIVLTHAHIDHTGYIPALVKNGFNGPIYCSKGTYALCKIMLIDSAHLQEEFAKKINSYEDTEKEIEPLYTIADAERSLKLFRVVDYDTALSLGKVLKVTLIRSGHILGSSFVVVSDGKKTLTFSGDLGRPDQLIMKDPTHLTETDYLVLDSTYGDRLHKETDPLKELSEVINQTVAKGGVVIIPAFAVGRTQTILYCLYQLKQKKMIPELPIFLDSPMAISVTNLFCSFPDEHRLPPEKCKDIFSVATFTRTAEESKRIDKLKTPAVIIAGSGMASGGRVLFHFKQFISDKKNTVLFVGFQGGGTHGRELVGGAQEVKLDGKFFTVRADIKTMDAFSGHADYNETLEWLSHFKKAPKKVFLTHGQIEAIESLKDKIEKRFGWTVVIPTYADSFNLK